MEERNKIKKMRAEEKYILVLLVSLLLFTIKMLSSIEEKKEEKEALVEIEKKNYLSSVQKQGVKDSKKLSVIIPWIGNLPVWINFTLESASRNEKYVWNIFVDRKPQIRNLNSVRIYVLPNLVSFFARKIFEILEIDILANERRFLRFKEEINIKPHLLTMFKPLYGEVFSKWIPKEIHDFFCWSDLDLVFGDLDKFTNGEMLSSDFFSFGAEDGFLFLRGQLSCLRVEKKLFWACKEWKELVLERKCSDIAMEEGCLSFELISNSNHSFSCPLGIIGDYNLERIHIMNNGGSGIVWEDGVLYIQTKSEKRLVKENKRKLQEFRVETGLECKQFWMNPKYRLCAEEGLLDYKREEGKVIVERSKPFRRKGGGIVEEYAVFHFQHQKRAKRFHFGVSPKNSSWRFSFDKKKSIFSIN